MEELVDNLRDRPTDERIDELDWMSAETKKKALEKLAKFTPKIGYPDKWRDYSALESQRDTYSATSLRANEFDDKRNLGKIGKPVDRDEWGMTPQTVNAYYNPLQNEIVFPAAILQPPFFDPHGRRRRELRRDRRGDRPRDRPRLRRPGLAVRRRRQPARLVDRPRTRSSSRSAPTKLVEQFNGYSPLPATERQRRAHPRREHRRPRRPRDRLSRLQDLARPASRRR